MIEDELQLGVRLPKFDQQFVSIATEGFQLHGLNCFLEVGNEDRGLYQHCVGVGGD